MAVLVPDQLFALGKVAEAVSVSVELQAVLSRINHPTHQAANPHGY
jgi:hypothetical protein